METFAGASAGQSAAPRGLPGQAPVVAILLEEVLDIRMMAEEMMG